SRPGRRQRVEWVVGSADDAAAGVFARPPEARMRGKLMAAGCLFMVLWFGCWATTVVPGSPAVPMQWAAGNLLGFLAGAAFAAAVCVRPSAQPGAAADPRKQEPGSDG
ncbi:MAG TPA: hypothetical protein VKD90_10055, partial [Gemmataceae bacterium]|nr:hypothetical protein [Gemmataceae bacterium]